VLKRLGIRTPNILSNQVRHMHFNCLNFMFCAFLLMRLMGSEFIYPTITLHVSCNFLILHLI